MSKDKSLPGDDEPDRDDDFRMDARSDATQNPKDKSAMGVGLLAVGAGIEMSEMESVRALTLKDGYDYNNNQMVA